MAVKEAYTTQDLVPLLKVSRQAIEKRIAREKWQARERARCGSREWLVSSMPEETRVAIRAAEEKQALALCPAPAPIPALSPSTTTAIMDDKRRYKALARADLVCQYLTWQRRHGATKVQKGEFIIAYKAGAWPKLLEEVGPVSWQTLERWKLEQERAGSVLALADRRGVTHKGKTMLTEEHKRVILGHVLNPNGAKVSQCVREVQKKFQAAAKRPLCGAVAGAWRLRPDEQPRRMNAYTSGTARNGPGVRYFDSSAMGRTNTARVEAHRIQIMANTGEVLGGVAISARPG